MGEAKTVTTQEIPKPQPYLTTSGKKIFKAICSHLIEHNILCSIDGYYISMIAHNMDIYNRMMAVIEVKEEQEVNSGYFQVFQNGTVQNSPYFNAANKSFDIIEKGCQKLGMTPYSRDKILAFAKIGEPEGDDDDELDLVARVQQALKNKIGQS